ncbi:odorant receptor 49b-like isoform X2 [Phymastichus coffea]|nr:odorant receptor 49b-like isoform X2 [Phymastichus coffea]
MEERRALLFENSAFFHKVVGLWPKEDQPLGNFRALKCHAGIFSTIAIAIMQYSVLAVNDDKSRRAEFSIEAAIANIAFMKILPCILNRKKMIELYHKTLEINTYLKESSAEKRIAYKWLSLQVKLISGMIVSYVLVVSMYFSYPLYRGDIIPICSELVPKVLHRFPWNIFVYVAEFALCALRLIEITSCDAYLLIFMCQLCSELQIAGNAMQEIGMHDKRSIYRAVKKHKRVLEYGQMICMEFSSAVVIQHLGMSIGICFSAISILYTREQGLMIKFVSIGLLMAFEVLLLCFVGEIIVGESLKIANYLENKYEDFLDDTTSLKTMRFMLFRSQRPLNLRVGGSTVMNLNLFRLTMNKIFSCFVILKRALAE